MPEEDFMVTSMEFKGESRGHYSYLLTFNQSLVHTGRLNKIEKGLNNHHKKVLSKLEKRMDAIPTKKVDMQVAHKYPGYRGAKEFIPKRIVMQIIEEIKNEQ